MVSIMKSRSYKNGYVWNDLGENDVMYPSEGADYVLKGSELMQGCTGLSFSLFILIWRNMI